MRKTLIHIVFSFFTSVIIVNIRLLNFAKYLLAAIENNNSTHEYDLAIAQLQPAVTNYQGDITAVSTGIKQQKGKTYNMDGVISAFEQFVHVEQPHLAYMLRTDHAAYLEFFSHGLDEYNKITVTDAPVKIKSFRDAAFNHVGTVGAPFLTSCDGFVTDFAAARSSQHTKINTVNNYRDAIKNDRKAIIEAIIYTLCDVMKFNRTDEGRAETFCKFSLLYRNRLTDHVHFPPHGLMEIPPNSVKNYGELALDNADELTFHNPGATDIWVYGSATDDGIMPVTDKKMLVKAGKTKSCMAEDIDAIDLHFINGFNINLTLTAETNVDIHDAV